MQSEGVLEPQVFAVLEVLVQHPKGEKDYEN